MPKTKVQKQEVLRTLNQKISQSKSIIFTAFNALEVKDNEKLRALLRQENGEYYVAKKTLIGLALKEANLGDVNVKDFPGKTAAIFSYGDEVSPAKVIFNFRKDKDKENKITFIGGILEGKFLTKAEVEALSQLPSKHELYSKLVGSLNAPVSGFVNVLGGNLRGLVTALKAIADQKA
jgi:large subunit ribosomal protein L10